MKKRLVSLLAAGLIYSTAQAQVYEQSLMASTSEAIPATSSIPYSPLGINARTAKSLATGFSRGDILISPGISFGTIGYGAYIGAGSGFLPLSASLEYSLSDMFAIGPYLGFYSRSYDNVRGRYRISSLSFGIKGTIHATGLVNDAFGADIDPNEWDLFASAYLGMRTYGYTGELGNYGYSNSVGLWPGLTIGGRYFFNPNVGVFLELGYGIFGAGAVGASFRL